MVFKPFTTIARQSISKHLINGYTQSLVAASQSSYASSTLPIKFGQQNVPPKIQNAFGGAHSGRAPGRDGSANDVVNAFYAAQASLDDKEDKKYLFSRKILWSKAQHQQQQKQLLGQPPEPIAEPLPRSRSPSLASASDGAEVDENLAALAGAETAAEAGTAAAAEGGAAEAAGGAAEAAGAAGSEGTIIAQEQAADAAFAVGAMPEGWGEPLSGMQESAALPEEQNAAAERSSLIASEEAVFLSEPSEATKQFNLQLQSLHQAGRWEELTVLFRHLVDHQGVKPSTASYNLLLDSIVSLRPRYVSQVMDVYSAMLGEPLAPPTTTTYSILISFLASRALLAHDILTKARRDASRPFPILFESKGARALVQDVAEDEGAAMQCALALFRDSTGTSTGTPTPTQQVRARPGHVFSASTYTVLIEACSRLGLGQDMLDVAIHMETHGLVPTPVIVGAIIRGLGQAGDARAACEAYNGWQQSDSAKDPCLLNERYEVYSALIAALIDSGDSPAALAFLEKVVAVGRDQSRLECLKRTVVEGFVSQRDILSAKAWFAQLTLEATPVDWLCRICTLAADQGDFSLAHHIFSSANLPGIVDRHRHSHALPPHSTSPHPDHLHLNLPQSDPPPPHILNAYTDCLMSCFASLPRSSGQAETARLLWASLSQNESPHIILTALVGYVGWLCHAGHPSEAVVTLYQESGRFLDRFGPDEVQMALLEAFNFTVRYLSSEGLLNPSIALDIAGCSLARCGLLGAGASRCVLELFDADRIRGLTPAQLSLTLQLGLSIYQSNQPVLPADDERFEVMFRSALRLGFPVADSPLSEILHRGAVFLAQARPGFAAEWQSYVGLHVSGAGPAAPPPVVADEDPYEKVVDVRTSDIIDSNFSRCKYNKMADLRRMYNNSSRGGKCLRLTTLASIVALAGRSGVQNAKFIDEIVSSARKNLPWMPQYAVSQAGWSELLNAVIAAHLALENRDKANHYHQEMLALGISPSANTYGLFIVHLKGAHHQTYDEASEAVEIFQRALAEGVTPTPFLYNAVIGKLAKARRIDDCLQYFAMMRTNRVKPTSVTFGTMINALTRVGEEAFAEELFQEMEAMDNYKPRPAPYNSMIQFFITTKRDRAKVLSYFNRMISIGIKPTGHTYKLLIEAHATLDEPDMEAAEAVLETIRADGLAVESSHHAALMHAKGCVLHDVPAAIGHFQDALASGLRPDSTLYQALLECLVANHCVADTPRWVKDMADKGIEMTPYIANTLIHGWALEKNIAKARDVYESLGSLNGKVRREPSTYEAMTRAYLAVEDREGAQLVANEMAERGYPKAVLQRVYDLVGMP